ncbi:MAG: Major facilitator superfamily [Candidatus Woesebacteria bacterium GW2011_GWA2_44_33]|uniref:Major facilitator superfamily n=1 Tax=Candidatus Woesebacteria bacterium GW2011_GWA2_44_33 TaxID=1618564 RepID=A0A0G1J2J6_9BACT|nr:MAG: Major facilitator superfamily [Candidatus Woesebacteria bacterium GW2011_GWA2_44_33]
MKLVHFWDKSYRHKEGVNGVQVIYVNNLLRTLAFSLGGLFSPLYIFLLGFEEKGLIYGLKILILSIVIERIFVIVLSLPMGKLVFRLGFKWSVLLGSLFLSIVFLLPVIFPRSLWLIVVMSILSAFEILLYWLARLSLMSLDGDRGHYGHEVSFMAVTSQVVAILGPFVGGYLVTTGGFRILFAVVAGVSIISSLPMFFVENHKIKDGISVRGMIDFVKSRKNFHLNIAFFGQGINNAIDGFFWVVYFYLIVKNFELIGGITSVITALTILVIYLAGRRFDQQRAQGKHADGRNFTIATYWIALLTFIRPLFTGLVSFVTYDLATSLSGPFWYIPYDSYLFSAGKRAASPLAFFTYREVVYSVGRLGIAMVLFFLISIVPTGLLWWVIFAFSAIGILMTGGLRKES